MGLCVWMVRGLRVCGCCTGGGGDGRTKQERDEFLTKRTTARTYILYIIGYKTIFTFIGYTIQLFSLDKISTIIPLGLAALIFSVSYFTSRAPRSSCYYYYYIRLSQAADQTIPVTAFWT